MPKKYIKRINYKLTTLVSYKRATFKINLNPFNINALRQNITKYQTIKPKQITKTINTKNLEILKLDC